MRRFVTGCWTVAMLAGCAAAVPAAEEKRGGDAKEPPARSARPQGDAAKPDRPSGEGRPFMPPWERWRSEGHRAGPPKPEAKPERPDGERRLPPAVREGSRDARDGHRQGPPLREMFDRLDRNDDGKLSFEEFAAGAGRMMEAMQQRFRAHAQAMRGGPDRGRGPAGMGPDPRKRPWGAHALARGYFGPHFGHHARPGGREFGCPCADGRCPLAMRDRSADRHGAWHHHRHPGDGPQRHAGPGRDHRGPGVGDRRDPRGCPACALAHRHHGPDRRDVSPGRPGPERGAFQPGRPPMPRPDWMSRMHEGRQWMADKYRAWARPDGARDPGRRPESDGPQWGPGRPSDPLARRPGAERPGAAQGRGPDRAAAERPDGWRPFGPMGPARFAGDQRPGEVGPWHDRAVDQYRGMAREMGELRELVGSLAKEVKELRSELKRSSGDRRDRP